MTIEQLNLLLADQAIDKIKSAFEVNKDTSGIINAIKQFNPKLHDIFDESIRQRKLVSTKNLETGTETTRVVDPTRIAIPFQKRIVNQAVSFLGSPELQCTPRKGKETVMRDSILRTEEDNKMDFRFKKISRYAMSEKECAELWYMQPAPDGFWQDSGLNGNTRLKVQILHNSYDPVCRTGNDTLYPVFDFYGDMIAFGRGYILTVDGKEEEHLDIYTADRHYFAKRINGFWKVGEDVTISYVDSSGNKKTYVGDGLPGIPNSVGKIPVIYYSHPIEWEDVQKMIDRLEKKISNHADTNDRVDSPIVFAEGEVEGFADKDDTGKLLIGKNGAKVSYLTWDNAPESMKMEIENLQKFIGLMTNTANTSFESMKGLGQFSGIALKLLFMDSHMKASINEEYLGESVQRRYNFIKSALIAIDPSLKAAANLKVKPKFTYFLPENVPEVVSTLKAAMDAGLLSVETAITLMPKSLVSDPDQELARIRAEKSQAVADAAKAMMDAAKNANQNNNPNDPNAQGGQAGNQGMKVA